MSVPSERCTVSSRPTCESVSDATSSDIPRMPNRSWWPRLPIRSGRGTSRSCSDRRSGPSYYLYVILDIYSRYVVGWMLASRESQHLAERLIRETLIKEGIGRDQLTIHSDRGAAMRSQDVAQLLATLGPTRVPQQTPCQ